MRDELRDLWGPPHDHPRTMAERKALVEAIKSVIHLYPGVTLAETGIERRAGLLDDNGDPMDDVPVVYVTFPGGECAARCMRGGVVSFRTKGDRTAWEKWQASREIRNARAEIDEVLHRLDAAMNEMEALGLKLSLAEGALGAVILARGLIEKMAGAAGIRPVRDVRR